MINMLDILKTTEKVRGTEHVYIVVQSGKVKCLSDGMEIPTNWLLDHVVPEDGIYRAMNITCDGVCEVGNPDSRCSDSRYVDKNCCTIQLSSIFDKSSWIKMSHGDLFKIIEKLDRG